MDEVYVLVLTKFRAASERAVEWMDREEPSHLLIDLPVDMTPSVRMLAEGRIALEELWKEYRLLTGLEEPYVNALRLSKDIVLDHLLHLKERTRPPKISCYLDLQDHLRAAEVSEKLLLLEAAERVRSRIRGEEWRRLLAEELECSRAGWEKALENLSEALRRSEKNAILYGGVVRPLREHLERDGYRVSLIYLQPYWRSPLDVLRMMVLEHGMDGVSDEIFEECIRKHLRYLDYVVYSEDLDSAHNRWARETIPSVYPY